MKNLRLTQGQYEMLHAFLIGWHVVSAVSLASIIGLWALPICLTSYCALVCVWYILSKDEWVTLFTKHARGGTLVKCKNDYYHIVDEGTYFRILITDTLIVYVNGKSVVYPKAGVFAVRILRCRLEKLK